MKGLVLKILRGNYPSIPSTYSQDLKDLVADMLIKDPMKRPSMRKILEKPFLSARITKLLTMTIAKNEFSNTFVTNHLKTDASTASLGTQQQESHVAGNSSDTASNVVVSKAKIVLNKDAGKR